MELPSQEKIPNHHISPPFQIPKIPSNGITPSSSTLGDNSQPPLFTKVVNYKECLKNHAASMGGNAIDGCGEFMPSGEEGSLEALTCSACNCHRNFHRKEIGGENSMIQCLPHYHNHHKDMLGRKVLTSRHSMCTGCQSPREVLLGHPHHKDILGNHGIIPSRASQHHQMVRSSYNYKYNFAPMSSDQSDELEENGIHEMVKKRFRTKFTHEQKMKMLKFAEKVEWKIQKKEESVLQQFCQEIGVERKVLKVWMHNNKLNLAKKNNISSN